MRNAPVVWINGWPGVGKQTVAECLALLLGNDKATLVSDQDQVEAAIQLPHDHPDYANTQKEAREDALAKFVEHSSGLSRIAIFTDCQPDTPEGRGVAQTYEIAAGRSNRLLVPVYLNCSLEENNKRLQTLERKCSQKDKIRSLKEARSVRSSGGLFIFPQLRGLRLDVTDMAPHEAAVQILTFMNDLAAQIDRELANDETTPLEGHEPDWPPLGMR